MTEPEGLVVPPAAVWRPLVLTVLFGTLFAWAVSGLASHWTFSPELRDDLLVGALAAAVAVTGTLFYLSLGRIILDVGQPQLWVDDTGIKAPAMPRIHWAEIDGATLRRRSRLRRCDCELVLHLADPATTASRMTLWQRFRQRKRLRRGSVVIVGQRWPMDGLRQAIDRNLAWHRHHAGDLERKLVRHLGERSRAAVPGGRAVGT